MIELANEISNVLSSENIDWIVISQLSACLEEEFERCIEFTINYISFIEIFIKVSDDDACQRNSRHNI